MNKLPRKKRAQALNMLVEGSSMRSVSRVLGISINTVTKLLVDAGETCALYHNAKVRNLNVRRVQCDEIWSFTYAKQRNAPNVRTPLDSVGDTWTWTAIDQDSKLVVSWLVGGRDAGYATEFMQDVSSRLATRVQLSSDGYGAYLDAVDSAFGGLVDYGQLIKVYGEEPEAVERRRYSPAPCISARKVIRSGHPEVEDITTSHVERHNLTMRMSMRRFTRLTNAFSKKQENHSHMVALYTVWYNFCRTHTSLSNPYARTPAMAAGLTNRLRDMEWVVGLMEQREPAPGPRGPYRPRPNSGRSRN